MRFQIGVCPGRDAGELNGSATASRHGGGVLCESGDPDSRFRTRLCLGSKLVTLLAGCGTLEELALPCLETVGVDSLASLPAGDHGAPSAQGALPRLHQAQPDGRTASDSGSSEFNRDVHLCLQSPPEGGSGVRPFRTPFHNIDTLYRKMGSDCHINQCAIVAEAAL